MLSIFKKLYDKACDHAYPDFVSLGPQKVSSKYFIIRLFLDLFSTLGRLIGNLSCAAGFDKVVFVRLNLDHFGPVINVYALVNSTVYCERKYYVFLAKRFSNSPLLLCFPSNVVFLSSFFSFIFFRGLFWSDLSINLVGALTLDHEHDCGPVDFKCFSAGINDFEPLQDIAHSSASDVCKSFLDDLGETRFVLLYCRTPGWKQSAQNSARNMLPDDYLPLIQSLTSQKVPVIRFGGHYQQTLNFDSKYFLDTTLLRDCGQRDLWLWSNCACVIGSISGATHVPSLIFRKPTLYLGNSLIVHFAMLHGLRCNEAELPHWVHWAQASVKDVDEVRRAICRSDSFFEMSDAYRNLSPSEILETCLQFLGCIGLVCQDAIKEGSIGSKFKYTLRSSTNDGRTKLELKESPYGNNVIFCGD